MTLALDRPTATATDGAPTLPAVVGAGVRVPLVTGGWVDYANLDLAASAPALQSVADHVAQVLPLLSSVHRGAGYLSRVSTAAYEDARETAGRLRAAAGVAAGQPAADRRAARRPHAPAAPAGGGAAGGPRPAAAGHRAARGADR